MSVYAGAALVMFIQTAYMIPYLSRITGQETILFWFIVAGLGIFTPLIILGKEFIWHGVMLPRQELAFGKFTWLFHGYGWGLFHVAFGWKLLVTLGPGHA